MNIRLRKKIGSMEGAEADLQRKLQQVKVSVTYINSYCGIIEFEA